MARGDVVSDIQSIAAGANLDFQPAAGVEVMITEVGSDLSRGTIPNELPDITVSLYDGTNASIIRNNTHTTRWTAPLKLFINNTNRLRILNDNASTAIISYCGIQTK